MKRNFVLLLAVLVAAGIVAGSTNAAVPMLLSHQGRLLDAADQPVTGTRDLTFRIYDVPAGGAPLWTETHLTVPVSNGLFNVILGSSITISGDLIVTGGTLETERYLAIQVAGDASELSPRRRLTAAAYSVASSRVSGDVETLPGELTMNGMSGSTTATIRASQNPADPGSELSLGHLGGMSGSTTATIRAGVGQLSAVGHFSDGTSEDVTTMVTKRKGLLVNLKHSDLTGVDGDQSSELATDSGGSELKLVSGPLTGMMGSTTATIRTGATGGGGGGGGGALEQAYTAIGRFSDATTESFVEQVSDATGASSRWKGMSGSTTGTIRMTATSDSVGNYLDVDDDGDGHSERNIGIYVSDISGQSKMECLADTDDDGVVDNSVEQVSSSSKAYMAIKTKGTGAQRTTILSEASDSAIFDISVDDDGDGNAQAKGIVACKPGSGTTGGTKGKFSYDVDDDGDFDNEVDITSNSVGAGARLIGRGGSTTGTIRMTATADSSVFDLGITGSTTGTIRMAVGLPTARFELNFDQSKRQVSFNRQVSIEADSTSGRVAIDTIPTTHKLSIGGGGAFCDGTTWTNASDKNAKENFSEVNGEELLDKIKDLPVKQWNYKSEDESITHIGPTAQDFKKAFGVGSDDKSISTVDPSGIALAAIKELIKQNQELMKANEELSKRVKALEKKQSNQ